MMPKMLPRSASFWLILVAMSYLGLILFIPAMIVFYEAFHPGLKVFLEAIASHEFLQALKLTLMMTCIAVPLNTLFGLCAAWAIARNRFPGRALLMSIIDLPFSISPVVAGLMLVLLYGRLGWLGSTLETLGIKIIFSWPGMVLATIFVSLPFVAREIIPILEEMGQEEEAAAHTLGANDWQTFWRVILPNIRSSLLYGILLTNARAMGEFGAVSIVSGNILGQTSTLPILVEQAYKNYQTELAFGTAAILTLLAAVTLVIKEILEQQTQGRSAH